MFNHEYAELPVASPPLDPRLLTVPTPAARKEERGEAGAQAVSADKPSRPSSAEFIHAIVGGEPAGSGLLLCSKAGDPQAGGWIAAAAKDVDRQCPEGRNNYFNCSLFRIDEGAIPSARKERFKAFMALMLDDVGTKVDATRLASLEPTWALETSPGNFQYGYVLTSPIEDADLADRLQKAVAAAGLSDPGALGVGRWARLPNSINGKPKHHIKGEPFRCRLHRWDPTARFAIDQIITGLGLTLLPPLPSFPKPSGGGDLDERDGDVFQPAHSRNPVLQQLAARGLYKRDLGGGRHDITCPWIDEHSDGVDGGSAYFEPDAQRTIGGFRCHHSHGDKRRIGDLLRFLGLSSADARNRPRIRCVAGELNRVIECAERVLAQQGRYYSSGGIIVAVHQDSLSGDIRVEPATEQTLTAALAEAAEWERYDGKAFARCDPPARYVVGLQKAQTYHCLPVLTGIARQPFFRDDDGDLVTEPGYDVPSGRYASFKGSEFAFPTPSKENAIAALGRLKGLLEEFRFATEIDRSAALSAMLTAAVRPSLPVAPAFSVTASGPGSGKTYLCSTIYPFAGPGDPANVSYPTTSDEATKVVLSLLMHAPAAIVFDDMDADWKPHGAINRMLTSPTISDRILGSSKTAKASTRTLVLGSGNNIEPLRDLRRRVISIRLAPKTASPAMLSYKGQPAQEVRQNRPRYVTDALTIIRAWREAGSPRSAAFDIASFNGHWSDMCRQPLLWLGLEDPASSLREQVNSDPDNENLGDLLEAWHRRFGDAPVTLRRLLEPVMNVAADNDLDEAIKQLPVMENREVNRSKLGWYLKRNSGRIVQGLQVEPAPCSERKAWRVVRVQDELVAQRQAAEPEA